MGEQIGRDGHLSAAASAFLEKVKDTCVKVCNGELVSIRVFGSVLDGSYRPGVSDIDFLVIVKDSFAPSLLIELRSQLLRLEYRNNIAGVQDAGGLQYAFESKTAFYRSHFIFRESTLANLNYKQLVEDTQAFDLPGGKIAQRLLGIFVPWRLVISNIIPQSRIIEGNDSLNQTRPVIAYRIEESKAFLMNIGISLLGLIHSFISRDGTRTSLESLKWYLISSYVCLTEKPANLMVALHFFLQRKGDPLIRRFVNLRENYAPDRLFSLSCPLYLVYLQLSWGK